MVTLPLYLNKHSLTYFCADYFEKEYNRELDKLWKSALKKAGVLEGNVKEETTGPRIHIQEKDKNLRDVFSCDMLIRMKVTRRDKIEWGLEIGNCPDLLWDEQVRFPNG